VNSFIFSSDPVRQKEWAGFARFLFGGGIGAGLFLYLFAFIVDPFDTLPLSPPLERVPIASNARFSFPALARKEKFDSAVFGTSTARLLRPQMLNELFGGNFANLSMNSATAYEQFRLAQVYSRHHPDPKTVILGVDLVWCKTKDEIEQYTPRPFPEWMYDENPYNDFLHQFDLYTLEQAGRQAATLLGFRRKKYGLDGYTNFLPDPAVYDLGKVRVSLAAARSNGLREVKTPAGFDPSKLDFPALTMLGGMLSGFPGTTRKIVFIAPYHSARQSVAGSRSGAEWAECKKRIAEIGAATPNTVIADFMIESPFTTTDTNYWDPVHYSVAAADILMRELRKADLGRPSANYLLLGQ
jgi:hypothetical protein